LKPNLKHELRTPLNHIIGYSEMLLEECKPGQDDACQASLQRIHDHGLRLLDLVDRCLASIHGTDSASNANPRPSLSPELETRVGQILMEVEEFRGAKDPSGAGAYAQDLARIALAADRLKILATTLTHGGQPKRPTPPTSQTRRFRKGPGSTASHPEGVGPRLLVVDDDEGNREMLTRRLVRLGYAVRSASNGLQALAELGSEPADLVLLDLQMPEMDGFEALLRIRANAQWATLAVIILSASSDIERVARCIELGAEDYLPKPFNPVLLQARIAACLERKLLRDREVTHLQQIQEEQRRSDALLHAILPREIATELKTTDRVRPTRFDHVAVLFTDIVGFTTWCGREPAERVHHELQSLVESFEQIAERHGLEKIKTIGDSFMATAGLLHPMADPALATVCCGLEMIEHVRGHHPAWQIRAGIHVGPVSAGVVGRMKYQYDVWGDTVNTAARMEQAAPAGTICVEALVWNGLASHCVGTALGPIPIKGKGSLDLFAIVALR
jgi:class 3 adenylate cyclase